jgi:hypothetical protein
MSDQPRYFTFEQASAMVRLIRPLMGEIQRLRQAILDRQPEIWPVVEKAAGNGGSREASLAAQEFQRLDSLVREIQATGAIIKDINAGLVDFLALREDQEVYLCWKYGEQELRYWHDLDSGFTGRQLWV